MTNISIPDDFIRIAERTGQILEISNWVLNEVCRTLCDWQNQGYKAVRVDINLSGKDFVDRGVLYKLLKILQRYNLKPAQIGVEIYREHITRIDRAGDSRH